MASNMSYVYLPDHPGSGSFGCVAKTVPLYQVVKGYDGLDVNLDFDVEGRLIGIEIFSA
ncbi:DUF2283 domain-containing protein [Brevundimonas subvibrioides]|uniref:DUF2283 domain-containing protein n=1 Tax=Brevundimonas subvibrioides TaxID=74313 RepID=UPI0022B38274|nr:DUF2283 domain-containing protein [Brevundimonas subvibrioides]